MQKIKIGPFGLNVIYAFFFLNLLILLTASDKFQYGHVSAFAADQDSHSIEIYSHDRPSIFSIQPKAHPQLGTFWEQLKISQLETIALFVEIYSNFERYYLARDTELLFDLDQLLTQNDDTTPGKSHLLNVSRINLRSKHIKRYLHQEGISNDSLAAGKKIVLIDTGYQGTIPRTIQLYYPPTLRSKIFSHLITSKTNKYPSTRVFLTGIYPDAARLNLEMLNKATTLYEHFSKFTHRSTEFRKINGKWEAVSFKSSPSEQEKSPVSPSDAQKYMEDLSFFASLPETQEHFNKQRTIWRKAKELYQTNDKVKLIQWLKEILEQGSSDPFAESMVRDFIEITKKSKGVFTQNKNDSNLFEISNADLGLEEIANSDTEITSQLKNQHPQWAFIIENPKKAIKAHITKENYDILYQFISIIKVPKFYETLAQNLANAKVTPNFETFVRDLIKLQDPVLTDYLTRYITQKTSLSILKNCS